LVIKYNELIAACLEAIKEQDFLLKYNEEKLEQLEKFLEKKGL